MRPFQLLPIAVGILSGAESRAAVASATVVVLRGTAKTDTGTVLKEQDKVAPGTTVITGARSFARLLFADQTQLNVGPETTMKIETSKPGTPSVVDLVGGQIRAKVTKDPLLGHDDNGNPKEKMVVKTKTAAMGIRGTDFNVSFNPQNNITALITFEGNVAMAKMEGAGNALAALHQDKNVQSVGAGQYSGVQPDQPHATIPVKISPAQLETLKGNPEFKGLGEQSQKQNVIASPIPPGVDPKAFASNSEKSLQAGVAHAVGGAALDAMMRASAAKDGAAAKSVAPPEGFLNKKTGDYAPRAGGFIDLASGRYVPPPAGSTFDPNTGVFLPPRALGSVDPKTGMYVPPRGVTMDAVKGFIAEAPRAADGARNVAGTAPPPQMVQLAAVLNTASSPSASTQAVTTSSALSAGGGVIAQVAAVQQAQPASPTPASAPAPAPAAAPAGGASAPSANTNAAPAAAAPAAGTAAGASSASPSSSSSPGAGASGAAAPVGGPEAGAPPPPPGAGNGASSSGGGSDSSANQPPPPTEPDPQQAQPVSQNCASNNSCGGVSTGPAPTTSTGVSFHINVTD